MTDGAEVKGLSLFDARNFFAIPALQAISGCVGVLGCEAVDACMILLATYVFNKALFHYNTFLELEYAGACFFKRMRKAMVQNQPVGALR